MAKHLIVSCGTSQIEKRKLDRLGLRSSTKRYCESLEDNRNSISDETVNDLAGQATELITKLAERWNSLPNFIGKSYNPFGAEISTLWKMHQREKFNGSVSVTLLFSDTMAGAFCAAVLKGLLTNKKTWGLSVSEIGLKRVRELREDFARPSEAEENLCQSILASLKRNKDRPDVLVVTGGFKSVIPFFTLIALKEGVDMYYLYEQSENLCCLNLRAFVEDIPERRSFWQQLVSRLIESPDTPKGLRIILESKGPSGDDKDKDDTDGDRSL
jgi:putative CRISPR-associated protein (TIGR02619 family)